MGLVLIGLILGAGPAASVAPPSRFELTETHMGSPFRIVLYSEDETVAKKAARAAHDRIAELDGCFSDYNPESELSRFSENAGGPPVRLSPDLFAILQRSKSWHERSGGAFDVTVGPAVRQWRRAGRDHKMPTAENLSKARSLISSDGLTLDPEARTGQLAKPGMKLDLGGIAKGWASDEALRVLQREGITSALVAGAGDIVVSGPPPGKTGWVIGVAPLENPEATPERYFSLKDAAVSTSGDAERFVEIEGKRYSHIVDPRTALGVIDRASVTIISKEGATADALATAVYALGSEKGLPLVENTTGAACLIVRKSENQVLVLESRRLQEVPRPEGPGTIEPAARLSPR